MAFTTGNDINILQQTDLANVNAGAGNDRYVLSPGVLNAGQSIVIGDTQGANILQLEGGLTITSSSVANDAVELTLSNGAKVTILGASAFTFQTGGSPTSGVGGTVQNFSTFVTQSLGTSVPAAGAPAANGGSVTVNQAGGTTAGPANPNPPSGNPAFTLTTGVDNLVGDAQSNTFTSDILTLNDGDAVDGGAGVDTLNATLAADVGGLVRLNSVENVNINALGARRVDAINFVGLQSLNAVNSSGAITATNINGAGVALGFTGNTGTNNINATYIASGLSGNADVVRVNTNGATNVNVTVNTGFESALITNTGVSSIQMAALGSVNNVAIAGSGALTIAGGAFTTAPSVLTSSAFTGELVVGSATAPLTGATAGSSLILGSGKNTVNFAANSAAANTATNTIQTGVGNDSINVTALAASSEIIQSGAGDDTISVVTAGAAGTATALTANDIFNGGAGNDTLSISGAGVNSIVAFGIENLTLTNTATAANTIVSSDTALKVTAQVGNAGAATNVDLVDLTAGSTVSTVNSSGQTAGSSAVSVSFKNVEATSTVTLNAASGGSQFTTTNITSLTVDAKEAINNTDFRTNGATSVTLLGAKELQAAVVAPVALANQKLTTLTVTGQDTVNLTSIANVADLTTVNVTGVKNTNVGAIDGTKLATVSAVSSTGDAMIGNLAATAVATGTVNVTATGAKAASTGSINNGTAAKVGNVTVTATDGLATVGLIKATELGTVKATSTTGGVAVGAISATDAGGIAVDFTGKTFVSLNGTSATAQTVMNTGGNITAAIAGEASAAINFTNVTSGATSLTATNTGGLTTTITNASGTSNVVLGNAAPAVVTGGVTVSPAKVNDVTLAGVTTAVSVTGGTGVDQVKLGGTFNTATGTIALGGGVDLLDASAATTEFATNLGLLINLSDTAVNFDAGTAIASSIAAGKASAYNSTAGVAKVSVGTLDLTVSGIEQVTGTANADYIVGGAEANTITGGMGNDTIIAGAGIDQVALTVNGTTALDMDRINLGGDAGDNVKFSGTLAAGNQVVVAFVSGAIGNAAADVVRLQNLATPAAIAAGNDLSGVNGANEQAQLTNDENVILTGSNFRVVGTNVAGIVQAGQDRGSFGEVRLGSSMGDTLTSTAPLGGAAAVAAYLNGGQGNDTLTGNAGNDFLVGGDGDDSMVGADGNDSFIGGSGVDVISGGKGDDSITYGSIGDFISGSAIVDSIDGGEGTDTVTIIGNGFNIANTANFARMTGVEVLEAGSASTAAIELVFGGSAANFTSAFGAGVRTISLAKDTDAAGINIINAATQTDTAISLTLTGSAGTDSITGGSGNDIITGGAGADAMTGGAGNDTFVFASRNDTRASGFDLNQTSFALADSITDFVGNAAAAGDSIQFGLGTNAFGAALTFTNATVANVTAVTIAGGAVTVGAIAAQIQAASAGVASSAITARVYDVTLTTAINGVTRLLVLNDDIADIASTDTFVNITGVTGALNAQDFLFA